jgi:small GTP-binding protein
MAIMKVVVLGDTECGKTSFTQRYVTGNFPDPAFLRTTIGASFDTKKLMLPSGRNVTLSIWDFGGQQRFIEQLKAMIRGARAGLLFFDVSRLATLDSLEGYWMPAIEENSNLRLKEGDGARFILVGNKVDLIDDDRIDVVSNEMNYLCETYGFRSTLLSAKTGVGLGTLDSDFIEILDEFYSDAPPI